MLRLCLLFPSIDIIFQIIMLFLYNAEYHQPGLNLSLIISVIVQQFIFWLCILVPVVIVAYLIRGFHLNSVWRFLFVSVFTVYSVWAYGSMIGVLVMKASFFTIFMYIYMVNQIAKASGKGKKKVDSET